MLFKFSEALTACFAVEFAVEFELLSGNLYVGYCTGLLSELSSGGLASMFVSPWNIGTAVRVIILVAVLRAPPITQLFLVAVAGRETGWPLVGGPLLMIGLVVVSPGPAV